MLKKLIKDYGFTIIACIIIIPIQLLLNKYLGDNGYTVKLIKTGISFVILLGLIGIYYLILKAKQNGKNN